MTETLAERVGKTATWREAATSGDAVADALEAARVALATVPAIADVLLGADQVIYAGAGSSYYLAQAAAWAHREMLGRPALAAPLSELLLRPAGVISAGPTGSRPIVVISRSGSTSEAVAAAAWGEGAGHPVIGVTCRPDSPLANVARLRLVSPSGDEAAIVMTRSFTSMLALLLRVIAGMATVSEDGRRLVSDLDALPGYWSDATAAAALAAGVAGAVEWSRIVVLGGGGAFAIASEAGLKLTETGRAPTDVYQPLEFRHGPMSVIEPGVLVVGLLTDDAVADEAKVVREAVALGAAAWILGPADAVPIGNGLHPLARLPLLMPPIQSLALSIAIARGCDPDVPRHLDQVVLLEP